jgi:DNA polymerase III epsilon subunit-like protein
VDYFSVDVESSGPVPGIHNLLSLGVTHVRKREGKYQIFDDFYCELKPVFEGFVPAAMRIHGLQAERLMEEGLDPESAMQQFADWVQARKKSAKDRPVFVAHNAPFDWMQCAYYFEHTGIKNPFGHSALDTKALAMGRLNLAWVQTSLKNVADKLPNVPQRDISTLHHAGHDARYQALVFADLMNLALE